VTSLHTVAEQVGTNRILVGGKFHHPFGKPELSPEDEFVWRKKLVQRALAILEQTVDKPTVFFAEGEGV
jgi:glycine reductase